MKKLSVVVPVYFNEGSLQLLFRELRIVEGKLLERAVALELIFVDDGSADGSFAELLAIRKARPATRLVRFTRNFGAVQASYKTGLKFVTGDCFLVLAADLQDPPELILEMVDRWLAGAKFIACVRRERTDPFFTRLYAALYYRLLRFLVVKGYPDGGFDLALMDRAFVPHLLGVGKNINPQVFSYWLGFKPEMIEYDRRERKHGRSRWTFSKKLKFFADTLLGFSPTPLRLMGGLGAAVSVLSLGYGAFVVINGILGQYEVPGFATLACLISFLFGVVIFMLGLIGEYVWRIYDQVSGRPDAVIAELLEGEPEAAVSP